MSLALLETLSFSNSTTCGGLLDGQYWDTTLRTSGNTTAYLIPNMVYGLQQSTNEWTMFLEQNMPDPPAWLSLGLGNYTQGLEAQLAAKVMGTNNITLARAAMKNYTNYVGGLTATGVDYLTLGSLSGLNTYITSGDPAQAIAATFPGQVYQLFVLSQDCTFSEQQRAKFLGQALAMTSIVVVTSGKDGFEPKFETLLTKLNLSDVWPKIKGHFKDIGRTSPPAAYQTMTILEELSKRFPSAFEDVGPFTMDRIDLMIQALKDKGLTPDQINEKVSELAQFAKGAGGDGDVAERADEISYEVTGTLVARVDKNLHLILYESAKTTRQIRETFLGEEVPGFIGTQDAAFKITLHRQTETAVNYYLYQGGQTFQPTLPEGHANPGDIVPVSIDLVPLDAFVKELPSFQLTNPAYLSWIADKVIAEDFSLTGNTLTIHFHQDHPFSNVNDFTLTGVVQKYPGSSTNYGGVYLEFTMSDYAGRLQTLRLRHNAFDQPQFQLLANGLPYSVSEISSDGPRLSIVYSKDNKVATVYLAPPSKALYKLGDTRQYVGAYLKDVKGRYTHALIIDKVETVRGEESAMLWHGDDYVAGRLGAEIAYVVATDKLGLKNVILEEPSVGGRDLYTKDNTVAIQARLIRHPVGGDLQTAIQTELADLVDKLGKDYGYQPSMTDGYAILSYIDNDGSLKTLVVEVPRP
jgi:hypothetical protein